jgi:peptidoglycan hydrolase-like protein with peptidoglycan-binding domain
VTQCRSLTGQQPVEPSFAERQPRRSCLLAAICYAVMLWTGAASAQSQEKSVNATSALVREIQFMLLTVGIDPGPIDGNPKQLTNRAAHSFQQRAGLPASDIVENQPIPTAFLERLRRDAAQIMLKREAVPGTQESAAAPAAPAAPPPAAAAPTPAPAAPPGPPASESAALRPQPPPPPPPPDPFASCTAAPEDFRIGGRQYTPQSFLDEGFAGSNARAVSDLRQRLEEARTIAARIGGTALNEVQRQARVLAYFECRLKIEQAAAGKG